MTQPAENVVTSDPIVPQIAEAPAPVDGAAPDAVEVPPEPTRLQGLAALAAAEKARWRERRALKAERLSYTQRSAQTESQLRAANEELQRARSQPLEYAEERGMTAEQLAERVIKRGTQEFEVETIKQELARIKAEAAEATAAATKARHASFMRAAEDEFHGIVTADEDTYPTLSAMPRSRVIDLAHDMAAEAIRDAKRRGIEGFKVDPKKLAAHLEKQESEIYGRAKGKLAGTPKDSASLGASNDNGRQGTKQAGTPRTLTNAGATERGSMPVNFDELSDAEQNKILAQKLREGWRG